MITIKVGNVYSYLVGEVPSEIYDVCTLSYTYFYRNRFKQIKVKERRRMYFNRKDNSFPTGWLFSKIISTLSTLKIEYKIEDIRTEFKSNNTLKGVYPFECRPYQQEAIDETTIKGHCRGIISIGVGGGKSLIGAKIIEYYSKPTLYLVPSLLLLNQTYTNFSNWFGKENVGYIGDGEFRPSLVNISTEQTIWARIDNPEVQSLLKNTEVLILDEAHKIQTPTMNNRKLGNTWYQVAMLTPNAKVRIGLTATPGKEDSYARQLLEGVTGRILYEKSLSWLIENGYLSKLFIDVYRINISNPFQEWEKAYSENILKNDERNVLIVRTARELAFKGNRVLIIVNRIEDHGKVLMGMLNGDAESLYGEDSSKERMEVLERFVNKQTRIVVSTIIREGVDLPDMDAIILASGGKGGDFGRDLIQKLGRVVRRTNTKSTALLVDFFDDDGNTEYTDTNGKMRRKPNILHRHSIQRLNIYKREKQFEINFR